MYRYLPADRRGPKVDPAGFDHVGTLLLALTLAAYALAVTMGHGLFQTANNTAVMSDVRPDQRGVISGMLNLSRNLGRITGASVMGAVFAHATATTNIATAHPEAVAIGMRTTFAVAAILIVVALAIAVESRALATRLSAINDLCKVDSATNR